MSTFEAVLFAALLLAFAALLLWGVETSRPPERGIDSIDVEPVTETRGPVDIDDPATWPEDFDD